MQSYQTKISRKLRNLKKRLYDNKMNWSGMDLELLVLSITNDSHDDESSIDLKDTRHIIGYIKYPDEELPISNAFGNNQGSTAFHMYDILPIEFYCKWEDRVKLGDIIINKMIMADDSVKAMILQVVDQISRGDTDVAFVKYIVAPYTFNLKNSENTELKNVITDFIQQPINIDSTTYNANTSNINDDEY